MRVVAVTRAEYGAQLDLLAGMHRLRYRVFKDRLSWTVSVTGDKEIDRYDGIGPTYILVVSAARDVLGAVRLLPTLGPHMLADTFPDLLQGTPVPRSETYLEASRFCVDTVAAEATGSGGLNRVTMLLLWGVADWSLATGAEAITAVTDLRMERILRRAGWPMVRLGPALEIGVTTAVAGILDVSPPVVGRLRAASDRAAPIPADIVSLAA